MFIVLAAKRHRQARPGADNSDNSKSCASTALDPPPTDCWRLPGMLICMPLNESSAKKDKCTKEKGESDNGNNGSPPESVIIDIEENCVTKNSVKNNMKTSKMTVVAEPAMNTRSALCIVAAIFFASLVGLAYIYFCFPELEEHEKQHVKLPWDIEDAKKLGRVLDRYKDRYFTEVLAAIFITYIFLQTFAIPGSISLSILSGFLFRFPVALLLVCFCSATGASLCYLLSSLLGRRLVYKYWPERASQWATTVKKQQDNLLNYMLFLRVTPFLPNWFINIVAPVIDVPIKPFWFGTFFGVAPPSFVAIQAGQTLHQLSSSDAKFSWFSVILLAVFAFLSIIPVLVKQRLRRKFE